MRIKMNFIQIKTVEGTETLINLDQVTMIELISSKKKEYLVRMTRLHEDRTIDENEYKKIKDLIEIANMERLELQGLPLSNSDIEALSKIKKLVNDQA